MLMNSKKFGLTIEEMVKSKRVTYMEAVILFCEQNEVDVSTVGPMINKSLKEKIQVEAEKLKLIKSSGSATLPI